jgi:hypothetical protein
MQAQDAEFSTVLQLVGSFFPQYCPIFAKDMLPFNKSQTFILSLLLSTLTFCLEHHLLLGRQIFTK